MPTHTPIQKRQRGFLKGSQHCNFRHGKFTQEAFANYSTTIALLRNCTDVLLVLGCLSDKKKSSGNPPLAYAEIKTIEDCEKYIIEQIRLDQKPIDDCRSTTTTITEGK
jgi:hypothetical protein